MGLSEVSGGLDPIRPNPRPLFLAEGPGNEGMREPDGASVRGLPHSGGSSQLLLTPSPSYHRKVPSLTFLPHGGATADPRDKSLAASGPGPCFQGPYHPIQQPNLHLGPMHS